MPAVVRARGDLWAHVPLGDPKIERWLRFMGFSLFCRCDYYDLYRRTA